MATDIKQVIEEAAAGPASVSGDAGTVTQHSLSELIKADEYLSKTGGAESTGAIEKRTRGLRFTKLLPGGAA
jgi:hypothetical protein